LSFQIAGNRESTEKQTTHARSLVRLRLFLEVAFEVEGEVVVVGHRGEKTKRERGEERESEDDSLSTSPSRSKKKKEKSEPRQSLSIAFLVIQKEKKRGPCGRFGEFKLRHATPRASSGWFLFTA